jgi:hypothetical protein
MKNARTIWDGGDGQRRTGILPVSIYLGIQRQAGSLSHFAAGSPRQMKSIEGLSSLLKPFFKNPFFMALQLEPFNLQRSTPHFGSLRKAIVTYCKLRKTPPGGRVFGERIRPRMRFDAPTRRTFRTFATRRRKSHARRVWYHFQTAAATKNKAESKSRKAMQGKKFILHPCHALPTIREFCLSPLYE